MKLSTTIGYCLILLCISGAARAFYCGDRIVSKKDTAAEVLLKCGEPLTQVSWVSEDASGVVIAALPSRVNGVLTYRTYSTEHVYDEWVYNFGSHRFIQIVRFKDGRVVTMETGNYGF